MGVSSQCENCCERGATTNEKSQSTERDAPEKYPKDKNNKQERKPNTIFNELQ